MNGATDIKCPWCGKPMYIRTEYNPMESYCELICRTLDGGCGSRSPRAGDNIDELLDMCEKYLEG